MKNLKHISFILVLLLKAFICLGQVGTDEENLSHKIVAADNVLAMAASPDGNTLAYAHKSIITLSSFSDGKLLKTLDLGTMVKTFPNKDQIKSYIGYIRSIDFSPDGKQLAVGFVGGLMMVDRINAKILWYSKGTTTSSEFDSSTSVYRVRCNNDYVFASSREDKSIHIWNIKDGRLVRKLPTDCGEILTFDITHSALNGKIFVSGRNGIQLLNMAGGSLWNLKNFMNTGPVAFSPNDSILAIACTGAGSRVILMKVYDYAQKSDLGPAADRSLGNVCWGADNHSLYCCAIGSGIAPVLQYSMVKKETVKLVISPDFDAETDCDNSAVVGGGGYLLAVAGKNKEIHFYRIEM